MQSRLLPTPDLVLPVAEAAQTAPQKVKSERQEKTPEDKVNLRGFWGAGKGQPWAGRWRATCGPGRSVPQPCEQLCSSSSSSSWLPPCSLASHSHCSWQWEATAQRSPGKALDRGDLNICGQDFKMGMNSRLLLWENGVSREQLQSLEVSLLALYSLYSSLS